ncbi:hypothetical protein SKAU_G00218360 [Synaphobranchus kaupii]|uniref:Uncharacterized protein n=1 Tax=Synaphobranchus kaupii TaxID=118154 RepID=A0A9Q1FA88_SYNKA|nr:hypothetical protein SKAU_G00218360 [Synaphobranchus kaupii]
MADNVNLAREQVKEKGNSDFEAEAIQQMRFQRRTAATLAAATAVKERIEAFVAMATGLRDISFTADSVSLAWVKKGPSKGCTEEPALAFQTDGHVLLLSELLENVANRTQAEPRGRAGSLHRCKLQVWAMLAEERLLVAVRTIPCQLNKQRKPCAFPFSAVLFSRHSAAEQRRPKHIHGSASSLLITHGSLLRAGCPLNCPTGCHAA